MNAYFSQRLYHLSYPNKHFLVAYTQKTTVSPTRLCLSINSCLGHLCDWRKKEAILNPYILALWSENMYLCTTEINLLVVSRKKLCSYSLWQAYGRQQLRESCVTIIWRGVPSYSNAKGKHSSGRSLSARHLREASGHSLGSRGHQGN